MIKLHLLLIPQFQPAVLAMDGDLDLYDRQIYVQNYMFFRYGVYAHYEAWALSAMTVLVSEEDAVILKMKGWVW